ncbi:MAG: pectin acetylesterase-family hydrolase [Sandaracinaceae bacterium]
MSFPRFGLVAATLWLVLGCEGEPTYTDGLPPRPMRGEWIDVLPGGDTVCARGDAYRFYVRGGDPDKILIDFQGGGACWNASTCGFADSLFSDTTGTAAEFQALLANGTIGGVYSDAADAPFRDFTLIHIPYCTGDIHWGNARVEYGPDLTIEHRGFINASAALDWIYTRYPNANRIYVNGCSAGAYGAVLHSAYIAQQYPDARIAVLADSGAGIITDSFLSDSLPNWNAQPALPPFVPGLDLPLDQLALPDLYVAIGRAFPEMRLAQTATQFDNDQIFFYGAMGGDPNDWTGLFRQSLTEIDGQIDNFTYYVPPGSVHCVTPYPYFDRREVNGVRLADWVDELVLGDAAPAPVTCQGADCCSDSECDMCLAGSGEAQCRFCETWPQAWAVCE